MPSSGMSRGHSNWNITDYLCQDSTQPQPFDSRLQARFSGGPSLNFPLRLRTHENGCFWNRILFWRNSRSCARNQWTALLQKPLSRAVYGPVFTNPDASPFPSVVQIIRNNQIILGGCKNFNQSATEGQILTLLLAWEWDFKSKINWGISPPHRIVFGAAASCGCSLSRVENFQEKPRGPGKA